MGSERIMKYKVGDKVRVREDLNIDEMYGALDVVDEMLKKKIVTIKSVHDGYYKIVEDDYQWIDEMFEGLVEDELTAEEAIRIHAEMCNSISGCVNCPLNEEKDGYCCESFKVEHPDEVAKTFKQWKKNYEKKEIKTEIVDLIKIMKEVYDDETCIYAYEIDTNEEDVDEKMDELVKQYYEKNGGKIYAKFERLCRVKS